MQVDGAKASQLAGGIRGASAGPADGELTGSHARRELSDKAVAWMPPASPCARIVRLQHLPASSGKAGGSGGERAGTDWQRVPDGTVPAGAVSTGQKDAATLPWKWSAVFRLRASTVSSVSAHSKTSLRPYKCVLWHRALNAFCRIRREKNNKGYNKNRLTRGKDVSPPALNLKGHQRTPYFERFALMGQDPSPSAALT